MKRMLPVVIDVIRENKSNDPDVIAKNLKIKVHYRALPKALKGLLIKTPFTKDVVINSRIDVNHKKIALAHELGHIILHKGGYNLLEIDMLTDSDRKAKEYEANKFAFLLVAHTCLRNSPKMIDGIRNEKYLTFNDTVELLKVFENTGCYLGEASL